MAADFQRLRTLTLDAPYTDAHVHSFCVPSRDMERIREPMATRCYATTLRRDIAVAAINEGEGEVRQEGRSRKKAEGGPPWE